MTSVRYSDGRPPDLGERFRRLAQKKLEVISGMEAAS